MRSLLLACASILLSAVANADPGVVDGPRQMTIHYADLNLRTEQGIKVLYARIRGAAQDVCRDSGLRDLGSVALHEACLQQAIEGAVARVHNDKLTAFHEGKHHGNKWMKLSAGTEEGASGHLRSSLSR